MAAQRAVAFVREYLIDLNGKQAAIRAGYSAATAEQQASRLLRSVKVKAMVDEAMAERAARTEITADWVLGNLKSIAERCMQQEAVRGPDGEPSGEFKFDASGANRALELIGKHLGMFTDRVEHSGPGGGPLPITVIELVAPMAAPKVG